LIIARVHEQEATRALSKCAEIGTFRDLFRLGRRTAHAQQNFVDAESADDLDQSDD
jgi:hypothetical protein